MAKRIPKPRTDYVPEPDGGMIEYDIGAGKCWRRGTPEEVEAYRKKVAANRAVSHEVAENVRPRPLHLPLSRED